jgi:hypothetical protein
MPPGDSPFAVKYIIIIIIIIINFFLNYINISLQHFATNFLKTKINLKFTPEESMKVQRRSRCIYNSTISLASAPDCSGQTTPHYGRVTPRKTEPVPVVQEAKWALRSVWMDVENLKPTGVQFQNRPTRKKVAIPNTRTRSSKKIKLFRIWRFIACRALNTLRAGCSNCMAVAVQGKKEQEKWKKLYWRKTRKCILMAESGGTWSSHYTLRDKFFFKIHLFIYLFIYLSIYPFAVYGTTLS